MNNTMVRVRTEFFNTRQYTTILPPKERMRLAILAKNGDDDACAKLIFGMTRLILKLAIRDYRIPFDQLEDVVQEAYLDLFKLFSAWQPENKKIPKFNPELGNNPITYAYDYIQRAIKCYLAKNRSPIELSKKNSYLVGKTKQFLSSQENLSKGEIETYINQFVEDHGVTLKIFLAAFHAYHVVSLDTAIGYEEEVGETHLDLLSSSQENSPETHAMQEKRADFLYKIMARALSEREALVLRLRYGSNGYPLTLAEVSEAIGEIEYTKKTGEKFLRFLSRERVRQIVKKAEDKLKKWIENHPQERDALKKMF